MAPKERLAVRKGCCLIHCNPSQLDQVLQSLKRCVLAQPSPDRELMAFPEELAEAAGVQRPGDAVRALAAGGGSQLASQVRGLLRARGAVTHVVPAGKAKRVFGEARAALQSKQSDAGKKLEVDPLFVDDPWAKPCSQRAARAGGKPRRQLKAQPSDASATCSELGGKGAHVTPECGATVTQDQAVSVGQHRTGGEELATSAEPPADVQHRTGNEDSEAGSKKGREQRCQKGDAAVVADGPVAAATCRVGIAADGLLGKLGLGCERRARLLYCCCLEPSSDFG